MNQGGGVFTNAQTLGNLSAASVAFGDLDGDGDLDAFVAPRAGTSSAVWLNDGHGMLSARAVLGEARSCLTGRP